MELLMCVRSNDINSALHQIIGGSFRSICYPIRKFPQQRKHVNAVSRWQISICVISLLLRKETLTPRPIADKSGRSDFKIFLTGYPAFFNVDTPSCDYTTFYYYQPDHHGIHRPGNWAYLYQPLRLQLNNLVSSLNVMLSQVANSVNSQYPSQKVWFVDPNPRYNGHRFCEDGVTEPDDSRSDTWLFLSAWGDNSLPGTASAQDANNAEMSAVAAGNSTGLPDPNTCSSTLGQSTDWADRMVRTYHFNFSFLPKAIDSDLRRSFNGSTDCGWVYVGQGYQRLLVNLFLLDEGQIY